MRREKNYRKLAYIIMRAGMTRSGLAQKVGMSNCHLSQIVFGKRNPSRMLDRRIRTVLEYWEDDLYNVDVNAAENMERAAIRNLRYWSRLLETHLQEFSKKEY